MDVYEIAGIGNDVEKCCYDDQEISGLHYRNMKRLPYTAIRRPAGWMSFMNVETIQDAVQTQRGSLIRLKFISDHTLGLPFYVL